jgi:hypothetical protein
MQTRQDDQQEGKRGTGRKTGELGSKTGGIDGKTGGICRITGGIGRTNMQAEYR